MKNPEFWLFYLLRTCGNQLYSKIDCKARTEIR